MWKYQGLFLLLCFMINALNTWHRLFHHMDLLHVGSYSQLKQNKRLKENYSLTLEVSPQ